MCLETIHKQPKVADHDIVAYKIARRVSNHEGFYKTPIQWFEFELNKNYVDEVPLQMKVHDESPTAYNIYGGVFHLFKCLHDVKWFAGSEDIIIEAVIPEGSIFYEGFYAGTTTQCYGAKQVRYIKEIKP